MAEKYQDTKALIMSMAIYTTGSIFGPMLIFGGGGYALDRLFGTRLTFIFVGLAIAFVTTNAFLFRRVRHISTLIHTHGEQKKSAQFDTKP